MEPKSCGVLDTPLEPVIGLAEGETRWRSMTVDDAATRSFRFAGQLQLAAACACFCRAGGVQR